MTKELSIENIKKELIDKISNNEEVLEIFRKHEYSKDEGKCLREYGDSFIKENYIFNHEISDLADFISVEVDENEHYVCERSGYETWYVVTIAMALTNASELDRLSMLLRSIVTELYPNKCDYSNIASLIKIRGGFGDFIQPIRKIMFTIK